MKVDEIAKDSQFIRKVKVDEIAKDRERASVNDQLSEIYTINIHVVGKNGCKNTNNSHISFAIFLFLSRSMCVTRIVAKKVSGRHDKVLGIITANLISLGLVTPSMVMVKSYAKVIIV